MISALLIVLGLAEDIDIQVCRSYTLHKIESLKV
jgi:hypothetical protein